MRIWFASPSQKTELEVSLWNLQMSAWCSCWVCIEVIMDARGNDSWDKPRLIFAALTVSLCFHPNQNLVWKKQQDILKFSLFVCLIAWLVASVCVLPNKSVSLFMFYLEKFFITTYPMNRTYFTNLSLHYSVNILFIRVLIMLIFFIHLF